MSVVLSASLRYLPFEPTFLHRIWWFCGEWQNEFSYVIFNLHLWLECVSFLIFTDPFDARFGDETNDLEVFSLWKRCANTKLDSRLEASNDDDVPSSERSAKVVWSSYCIYRFLWNTPKRESIIFPSTWRFRILPDSLSPFPPPLSAGILVLPFSSHPNSTLQLPWISQWIFLAVWFLHHWYTWLLFFPSLVSSSRRSGEL